MLTRGPLVLQLVAQATKSQLIVSTAIMLTAAAKAVVRLVSWSLATANMGRRRRLLLLLLLLLPLLLLLLLVLDMIVIVMCHYTTTTAFWLLNLVVAAAAAAALQHCFHLVHGRFRQPGLCMRFRSLPSPARQRVQPQCPQKLRQDPPRIPSLPPLRLLLGLPFGGL